MELGRYFTFQNLIYLETRLRTYANILDAKGYENAFELSEKIHNHNSPFDISISNFDAELNSIEETLFEFDKIADWINPYSTEKHEFVRENGRLYPYIKRWVDWRDYTEKILTGSQQKEQYLFTIETGNEEQLFDINGEPIITLEGYFNL